MTLTHGQSVSESDTNILDNAQNKLVASFSRLGADTLLMKEAVRGD